MERPIKKDYLTCNQMECQSQLNKYYRDLEKYCDIIEQHNIVRNEVKCGNKECSKNAELMGWTGHYACDCGHITEG